MANQTVSDRLKQILLGENDFPSRQFERNYRRYKGMIIRAMREYSGSWRVDEELAQEIAWNMAEQVERERTSRINPVTLQKFKSSDLFRLLVYAGLLLLLAVLLTIITLTHL